MPGIDDLESEDQQTRERFVSGKSKAQAPNQGVAHVDELLLMMLMLLLLLACVTSPESRSKSFKVPYRENISNRAPLSGVWISWAVLMQQAWFFQASSLFFTRLAQLRGPDVAQSSTRLEVDFIRSDPLEATKP